VGGSHAGKDDHVPQARDTTVTDPGPRSSGPPASRSGATRRPSESGDPTGRAGAPDLSAADDRRRLPSAVFNLPIGRLRDGYFSDAYFNLTKELLEAENRHPRVVMQVFQRERSILGGIDEAIAILRLGAGHRTRGGDWVEGWDDLEVRALHEGDAIEPWETVMTIEGDYALFAHLETVYLGPLARRSLVMRNVRAVVEAAGGKPILFFPARHDHWLVQTGDGWSAHIAGAIGVSTDAQASWWGGRGVGTVPHGLIAAYGGDTVSAARDFARRFGADMNVTVLVDFANDSAKTAVEVADALGEDLWGVRLDTSGSLVDHGLERAMPDAPPGVSVELARLVRSALDDAGHERVRIVASGGFDAERIREFEAAEAPVDSYGVGSALLRGSNDFTADIVRVDGRKCAKVGREERPNPRLQTVP
jgi:nicotinate phosphoribosyltransferase